MDKFDPMVLKGGEMASHYNYALQDIERECQRISSYPVSP